MEFRHSNNQRGISNDSEISLIEILRFLNDSYKTIAAAGAVGLIAAIVYLSISPKRYEAVAQIVMAQIANTSSSNLNPIGVNVEEPSFLIARLSRPTSLDPQTISECKGGQALNLGLTVDRSFKLDLPKGIPNVVDLRTFAASPQDAQSCAQAIYEFIKTTQAQILAPFIEEAKIKLAHDEARLEQAKGFIAKADNSAQAMSAAYLSTKDEIRFLLDEIGSLTALVSSSKSRATRLINPVYVSDVPIAPKKTMVLVCGILGGLFLGLLFSLVRKLITITKPT